MNQAKICTSKNYQINYFDILLINDLGLTRQAKIKAAVSSGDLYQGLIRPLELLMSDKKSLTELQINLINKLKEDIVFLRENYEFIKSTDEIKKVKDK